MGALGAMGMADSVSEGYASLSQAMTWHLRNNHYPPVPLEMVDVCIEVIKHVNAEQHDTDWDMTVPLPEGVLWRHQTEAPLWAIVEAHHLEAFIEMGDE